VRKSDNFITRQKFSRALLPTLGLKLMLFAGIFFLPQTLSELETVPDSINVADFNTFVRNGICYIERRKDLKITSI
jgi:hypothetical protein